jgi:hypothetical protein
MVLDGTRSNDIFHGSTNQKRKGEEQMKKLASVLAVVALVATTATVSFAGSGPGTGVINSMHDINVAGGSAYHPYTWAAPANQSIAFNADPLVGPSRLCMACHDGVTAVDSHGSAGQGHNGSTALTASTPDPILGVNTKRYIDDLTVTHPIGFLYADAVTARNAGAAPEIRAASSFFMVDADVPANANTKTITGSGVKKISDTLYAGYFTCASCHEVHNTNNVASTAALSNGNVPNYFLWAPEQKSVICLSCHIK